MKRYSYTPRRNGTPIPRSKITAQRSLLPLIVPIVLVLGVITAVGLLTRSGASEVASCEGETCQRALALGASSVPTVVPASAQPTPYHSPYAPPKISGLSATVLEEPCGKPVYELNQNTTYPPASLTKMMTALVATNHANVSQTITSTLDGVTYSEETDGTVMGIELGEELTLRDLLYGLLMRSGSDAALVIAQSVGGSVDGFVKMMNDEATALGLTNTHFTNPHGLDDTHLYTSSHDIAIIGHELLKQPTLAQIVRTQTYTPNWDKGELENINLFLSQYPGAIGIKTGYTDTASQTIVAAATRAGRTLLVSVLHSADEYVDASALLDWAFDNAPSVCSG